MRTDGVIHKWLHLVLECGPLLQYIHGACRWQLNFMNVVILTSLLTLTNELSPILCRSPRLYIQCGSNHSVGLLFAVCWMHSSTLLCTACRETLKCRMVQSWLETRRKVLKVDCQVAVTVCTSISRSHHVKPRQDSSVTLVAKMLTG
jgi:hypothetical protein